MAGVLPCSLYGQPHWFVTSTMDSIIVATNIVLTNLLPCIKADVGDGHFGDTGDLPTDVFSSVHIDIGFDGECTE